MEALIILLPIVISVGSCIVTSCLTFRMNNRILHVEQRLAILTNNPVHDYHAVSLQPPQPSAPPALSPPGYGYQYYPNNQGLNIV